MSFLIKREDTVEIVDNVLLKVADGL